MPLLPCFSKRKRAAYHGAATKADYSFVNLVDNTVAALIASRDSIKGNNKVLVYSWGASTFSAVLYYLQGNSIQVMPQEGIRDLGGDDMDAVLVHAIMTMLTEKCGSSLPSENRSFLVRVAEEA